MSGKSVSVRLTWWDLVRINVGFMPRLCASWVIGAVVAVGAGVLHQTLAGPSRAALVLLSAVALAATFASVAGFLAAVAIVLSTPPWFDELLGDHTYTFEREGLRDRTARQETVIEWARVRDVRLTRAFILLEIAPGLLHALPRRSFSSPGEFRAFWRATSQRVRAVASAS